MQLDVVVAFLCFLGVFAMGVVFVFEQLKVARRSVLAVQQRQSHACTLAGVDDRVRAGVRAALGNAIDQAVDRVVNKVDETFVAAGKVSGILASDATSASHAHVWVCDGAVCRSPARDGVARGRPVSNRAGAFAKYELLRTTPNPMESGVGAANKDGTPSA